MNWAALGAVAMALGVALGAFGAHALRGRLDAYHTDIYRTAVLYHFVHAAGLLIAPVMAKAGLISSAGSGRVCLLLALGILLFSGSLYVLAISGQGVLGAITPLGGVAFIAAWAMLAWELLRTR